MSQIKLSQQRKRQEKARKTQERVVSYLADIEQTGAPVFSEPIMIETASPE